MGQPGAATRRATAAVLAVAACLGTAGPAAGQGQPPIVPGHVPLDPAAAAAVGAEWLTVDERRRLRVFHGVWDERDLDTPHRMALVALNAWELDAPSLSDPAVPVELRAEAKVRRGDLAEALRLLDGVGTVRAARLRAEAHEKLGRYDAALAELREPLRRLQQERVDDPAVLTEAVRAMEIRARIQGQPARDYNAMMSLLARAHQDLDRLYWPARLAEAALLDDKDNAREAVQALHETLSYNPRVADAWFLLGRIALRRFDFDSALLAAEHLRRIRSDHPLADLLLAESRLIQDDPDGALELVEPWLARMPRLREALALAAAAEAIRYDEPAMRAALDRYDALSPGSAVAYSVVGRHLSLNRQYELAAEVLGEAIRRQPAWPRPQIELGLMELQSGRDGRATAVLEDVVQLDPFNKRAANSLELLRQLASFDTVESEHFVIRYLPGEDEVMVALMPEVLERIHETVSGRFRHEPDRRTVIEVMPDHATFAVRITGMPWIHTIAASTGPVIAMQVPREGPPSRHKGPFDWARVLQHEYTHTINLSQTRNRIPHWLTEAAAVSMEHSPRDFDTCVRLATAYHDGELFDLDEIKWAFVRPRRPGDRSLAYAQSHWMVEYMNERFGESALVRLLGFYFDGVREEQAIPLALGVSRGEFYRAFLEWAGGQLTQWGLGRDPDLPTLIELQDRLRWEDPRLAEAMEASHRARLDAIGRAIARRIGRPVPPGAAGERFTADRWPDLIRPPVEVDNATIEEWLDEYPDHPDLLLLRLRREIDETGGRPGAQMIELLQRYAAARPVDPFPHKKLIQHWRDSDTPERAIPHLEALDAREQHSPVFAFELARLYRARGETDLAAAKAERTVQINPYDADYRELAAAVAVEAGRLERARLHIHAMTILEPGQPRHRSRLEAVDRLIESNRPRG